jgi:hypothetical protein
MRCGYELALKLAVHWGYGDCLNLNDYIEHLANVTFQPENERVVEDIIQLAEGNPDAT